MTTMEERVSRLEGAYEQVDRRLGDLTEAITRLDVKIDALRSDVDAKFDAVRSEMSAKFNTLIIVMATGAVGITGALITIAFRI
jgi:chromosome segregation ATPase